ncbi:hypothetical protein BT69DRAFT_1228051 [Atractiella rhizophila]|nr:hypothetical protein BT69DRAFT_1228051 [Atractiella rhizophila]
MKVRSLAKLEPADVKKLRILLRNEPPSWIEEWILLGGYGGLLGKLKEILELEWREEQHDDQVLHELGKCLKALLTTEAGRSALALHSPSPFVQLTSLLLSEKKPGDLPIRQIIVELILGLFEIFPHGYSPSGSPRRSEFRHYRSSTPPMAAPGRSAHLLVRSLIVGPPDPKQESKPDFMQEVHRPRIYKNWLSEFLGVLMDYFWVFCHSQNTFGDLRQMNQDEMEAPKVPGGMTGGVEFEAMAYCATHFKLINALARTCPSDTDAYRFHHDLFESGLERILMTLRKCSTTYYPSVHLELARYIDLARKAHYDLPAVVIEKCDGVSATERRIAAAKMHQRREGARSHNSPALPPLSFN